MSVAEVVQWIIRIALAAVFIFMGINHFRAGPGRGMAAMIPPLLKRPGWPSAKTWVRITGVCEIAGGIGLLVPWTRFAAGVALIVFLCLVFPANAYASEHPEKFGRAAFPFWPRFAAQLGLVLLVTLAIA